MGTPWRGLLAPINTPTGDGRRMADGAIRWRELPLGLKWQRTDSQGHDDSVVVGSTLTLNIGTVAQAIEADWISADAVGKTMGPQDMGLWGAGELFDDVDPAQMPRLAEDVAEAMHLLSQKVVGPSVDAGAATVVLVRKGSDVPLTGEELDDMFWEAMESGQDPPVEELFLDYQVAASTLVVIPAFEEARPFELVAAAADAPAVPALTAAARVAAVTANTAAAELVIPADVFAAPPAGTPYQTITVEDLGEGFLRVAGYVAPFGTCHREFRDACHTAPTSSAAYVPFHRYAQQVGDELVGVGRLTAGFGRVGTGCSCCPGKHDHACNSFGLAETISHYDKLTTLAHVRATETELGIWVAGYVAPGLDARALAALKGNRFSGDWREVGGSLELVEVLALTGSAREGFPPPTVSLRHGRRFSLTAASGSSGRPDRGAAERQIDYPRLGREVAAALVAQGIIPAPEAPAMTAADAEPVVHTGAMVALRMSDEDAQRLAVQGGEPADELHATRAYLGEAADWPADQQAALIEAMRTVAAGMQPFAGDPFALAMFNPDEGEGSCVVLGLCGQQLVNAQTAVMTALEPFSTLIPEQHAPHVEHITLQYGADPAIISTLTDLVTQPIQFTALRVAFAGTNIDIPLGAPEPPPEDAASLAAEVEAAFSEVESADRARELAHLADEVLEVSNAV